MRHYRVSCNKSYFILIISPSVSNLQPEFNMSTTLVVGGARSGKSNFAQRSALELSNTQVTCSGALIYLATAKNQDMEMNARIQKHINERNEKFVTIEESVDIVGQIKKINSGIIVVDCLTLWLTNLMMGKIPEGFLVDAFTTDKYLSVEKSIEIEKYVMGKIEEIQNTAKEFNGSIFFISNDVGSGIVPIGVLARLFQDLSGWMNQIFAHGCDAVFKLDFGIASKLK